MADQSKLDEKGRCCGRKPLVYKRDGHLFCCRCDRSFNFEGQQIENWAWMNDSGQWVRRNRQNKATAVTD